MLPRAILSVVSGATTGFIGLPLALFHSCDDVRAMLALAPRLAGTLPSKFGDDDPYDRDRTLRGPIERYEDACALRPRPDDAADETAVISRRRRRDYGVTVDGFNL